jgi:amidase
MAEKWETIAAAKRAELAGKIPLEYSIPEHLVPPASQLDVTPFPRESGWFSERELEITESNSISILSKVAARTWTAEEVTKAFCKRAAVAQQLVSNASESQREANR